MLGYNPRIELDGNRSNAGSTDQRPQFQHGMDHGCPTNGARCRPDPNTCNTDGLSKRFIPGEIRFRRSPAERETRGQRDGEPLHTPRRRLFQARTGSFLVPRLGIRLPVSRSIQPVTGNETNQGKKKSKRQPTELSAIAHDLISTPSQRATDPPSLKPRNKPQSEQQQHVGT
jgi:hypothetical protein